MSDSRTEKTRRWYQLQEQLALLKEEEMALRKEVIAEYFGDDIDAGTHKADIKEGVKLVVTVPKSISLDRTAFDHHKAELMHKGLIGDDRLIRVKYDVSATALKHLSEPDRIKFSDMFVYSTGSPQVKVEVAKG